MDNIAMQMFAPDNEVATLESELPRLDGVARLAVLVPLAWHLRQRDCWRARALVEEAQDLLASENAGGADRACCMPRLQLVMGELSWLYGDLDVAENFAQSAMVDFERLGDIVGVGDGEWLLASIWGDRGDAKCRDEWLESAIANFKAAGDRIRTDTGTARRLLYSAFGDLGGSASQFAKQIDPVVVDCAPVMAWVASARAIAAGTSGEVGIAIGCFLQAYQASLESGQIRQAIVAATNAADDFSVLGNLDAALEWDERALTLARRSGWPSMIGNGLMQTGNVLRLLGRHAEARAALDEALAVRVGLEHSNGYAITLGYLGDLSLDVGDPIAALDYFRQTEMRARSLGGTNLVLRSIRGQATALCRLNRPAESSAKVAEALDLAGHEGSPDEQIETLRTYAELYLQYPLPSPEEMEAPSGALHYLNRALGLAATIDGYHLPSELLDDVANAHAACGDYKAAYVNAKAASNARDSKRIEQARNRAIAMQARQVVERIQTEAEHQRQLAEASQTRAEAEHHRQLAETEARRAAALLEAANTLESLSQIGLEITASLQADAVFATLHDRVNRMLDTSSFDVYLLDLDGQALKGVFGVKAGAPSPLIEISLEDPESFSACCARERREIVIHKVPESVCANLVPGTLDTVSLLFAPLMVGTRLLGVMSVQSVKTQAYGDRERSIFRTLSAYAAIALDNAAAYSLAENALRQASEALDELRKSQLLRTEAETARAALEAQLRESQKMEAIGTLAGGIAHDFNNILATIIGNVELARQEPGVDPLVQESLEEIRKAGSRARDLVHQILSFSRRQPTERKRIALAPVIEESAQLLRATLPARLKLDVDCAVDVPAVLADATQIQQVLINLCTNAMHAMESGAGHINIRLDTVALDEDLVEAFPALRTLQASQRKMLVRLAVSDTGSGIEPMTLERIFEPFFTTRQMNKGTGLGLSVVHGIVQTHEGAIVVNSQLGKGSTFTVFMPPAGTVLPMPVSALPVVPTALKKSAPQASAGGSHFLYIDDDESLVFLVKRQLERRGFRVSGFTDQREALAALLAEPDMFDFVVSDYNMPGMSGLDVARAIRVIRSNLPVAIASGFIDEALQAQAEGAGVRELIFKANAVEDLCDAFARLARSPGVHSPQA